MGSVFIQSQYRVVRLVIAACSLAEDGKETSIKLGQAAFTSQTRKTADKTSGVPSFRYHTDSSCFQGCQKDVGKKSTNS